MRGRAAVAGACLGAGLLVIPAAPAAADGVALQLQGAEQPLAIASAQIEALADVPPTRYRVRDAPGRRARTVTLSGARLATVLRAAGVDPASLPTLEITRDDGSILYLPRNEIDPASGAPPLLYVRGQSVGFARASRGRDDVNGRDLFTSSSGTPIRITVSPTATLSVRVRAERARIEPGGRVRFEASAEGELPGEALDYEWRFGDGRTAGGGLEAVHRFTRRGRYEVVLRVTGDQGSGGSSTPVLVQVGPPARAGSRDGSGRERTTAPPSGATGGSGAGGATTEPRAAAPAPRAGRRAERRERRTARERPAGGRAVRGALLGVTAAGAETPRPAAGGPVAARAGSTDPASGLAWLAGAGACVVVLAAGAAAELRAGARRRRRVLGAPR